MLSFYQAVEVPVISAFLVPTISHGSSSAKVRNSLAITSDVKPPPLIALEEHDLSTKIPGGRAHFVVQGELNIFCQILVSKLETLGDEWIQDLNKGNASLQVISPHTPHLGAPPFCVEANNNDLAATISKAPTRPARLAILSVSVPTAAANELGRCVKELVSVGAVVPNRLTDDVYGTAIF